MAGADILRAAVIGEDMTEDELLSGITEALTFGGWRWTHIRRSDGITQGHAGLPDIIATGWVEGPIGEHFPIVLAWELKSARGQLTPDQWAWGLGLRDVGGVDWRLIRPASYDDALKVIIQHVRPWLAFTDPEIERDQTG